MKDSKPPPKSEKSTILKLPVKGVMGMCAWAYSTRQPLDGYHGDFQEVLEFMHDSMQKEEDDKEEKEFESGSDAGQ